MDEKKNYIVYRIYSKKERPERVERSIFYGWTHSKDIVKIFLKQRNKKKYKVLKMTDEEVIYNIPNSDETITYDTMIDFVKLRSAKTAEEIYFFTTLREMKEAEINIQRIFHNMSSIDKIKDKGDGRNYLNMIFNLDDYYLSALFYIGYRPPEIDVLFPSASETDNFSTLYEVEESIEDAYSGVAEHPIDDLDGRYRNVPGLITIEDVASKLIYSIESFVMVLKDDL